MSRFVVQEKKRRINKGLWSVILFVAVMVFFCCALNNFSRGSSEKQLESLERALGRDITYCYATEGHYPASLDEIRENYGLTWDEDAIFVGYRSMGANIYPDVTIIPLD